MFVESSLEGGSVALIGAALSKVKSLKSLHIRLYRNNRPFFEKYTPQQGLKHFKLELQFPRKEELDALPRFLRAFNKTNLTDFRLDLAYSSSWSRVYSCSTRNSENDFSCQLIIGPWPVQTNQFPALLFDAEEYAKLGRTPT